MVRVLCFCLVILASAPMSTAGLVTIDAMVPGPFPTSPSFLNASGVAVNNVTRTLTSNGSFGFNAGGQANLALTPGQFATLSYVFSSPLTVADFSVATNANWLMELNVTSSNLSAFQVTGFVNSRSYGLLTGTGGIINANFLNAISGNINSLSFRITNNSGPGLETIAINSVSAVPEPASLLTAGAFSLIGALVYRRRKVKKVEAMTA
jgi:PEP-CTERM motif